MLKYVLVIILLTPRALVWGALNEEATSGNGLEADSTTSLDVLIEGVSEGAKKIGLTNERIEARVNQSLRKAGITPVSAKARIKEGHFEDDYLYVNVNTHANSFTIDISFERQVFYRSGSKWLTTMDGSTWHTSATGTAPNADYILNSIAQVVDVFCNEFLKANGK